MRMHEDHYSIDGLFDNNSITRGIKILRSLESSDLIVSNFQLSMIEKVPRLKRILRREQLMRLHEES